MRAIRLFLTPLLLATPVLAQDESEVNHQASSLFKKGNYPSCNIVGFKWDREKGNHRAQHKCKAADGTFKCCEVALEDCVHVDQESGTIKPKCVVNRNIFPCFVRPTAPIYPTYTGVFSGLLAARESSSR
jgi:hypothetical protein